VSLLLLDTHVLLWSVLDDDRLSLLARALIEDPANTLAFSAASVWELAIKTEGRRGTGLVEPRHLRRRLLAIGYREFPISSEHGIAAARLPPIHRDPFDRMLVAQADVEGATLLTADRQVAQYPGPVRLVA
jgi:PIN domain nuclease of toxin-antitoxin system